MHRGISCSISPQVLRPLSGQDRRFEGRRASTCVPWESVICILNINTGSKDMQVRRVNMFLCILWKHVIWYKRVKKISFCIILTLVYCLLLLLSYHSPQFQPLSSPWQPSHPIASPSLARRACPKADPSPSSPISPLLPGRAQKYCQCQHTHFPEHLSFVTISSERIVFLRMRIHSLNGNVYAVGKWVRPQTLWILLLHYGDKHGANILR